MWEGDEQRYLTEADKEMIEMDMYSDFLEREGKSEESDKQQKPKQKKKMKDRVASMMGKGKGMNFDGMLF